MMNGPHRNRTGCPLLTGVFLLLISCQQVSDQQNTADVAANEDVASFMQQFEGRGDLSDSSTMPTPQSSLASFTTPADLAIDLVLSEPDVVQPVEINFDQRGRMWVVQYSQYPYPEGLKVTGIDHHIRMTFDRKPDPPPSGVQGADRISVFTDTNGDGNFDEKKDVISGLNIATGITWGRGQIWVLNPPYLLAYPDPDADGWPDGDPVVHVDGFGLEDTHAVANSLRWGPDGWLYGAQGSTCTANIYTRHTKGLSWQGQAIWRYHPEREVFEIFSEGGGNTFHVEFDKKGRLYSGTNGTTRGQYYKQGAYYTKNWGKHGALTHPYAFGYLPDMKFEGEPIRFTHAWIKYEGASLPDFYHGKMIAINPLHGYLQLSELTPNGSTFSTRDLQRCLTSTDPWFRPVDIKAGPDGAVYLADWCDSRLSHVDPRDTWHKTSGRIYRLRNSGTNPGFHSDFNTISSDSLVNLLSHPNKWVRQQVLRQFGDRKDLAILPALENCLDNADHQTALEALWAIHLTEGLSDAVANRVLMHKDPYVRMWAIRLLGDKGNVPEQVFAQVQSLASQESHPEVLGQLLSSIRRLDPAQGLPLLEAVLPALSADDPDLGLMSWWALESQLAAEPTELNNFMQSDRFWQAPVTSAILLERLMKRLLLSDTDADYNLVLVLLRSVPAPYLQALTTGWYDGLRGRDVTELPAAVREAASKLLQQAQSAPLAYALENGQPEALDKVVHQLQNNAGPLNHQLAYLKIIATHHPEGMDSQLRGLLRSRNRPTSWVQQLIQTLSVYPDTLNGVAILQAYPDYLRAEASTRHLALEVLTMRETWARSLWQAIRYAKTIHPKDIPPEIQRQLQWQLPTAEQKMVAELWPWLKDHDSEDTQRRLLTLQETLDQKAGDRVRGAELFKQHCSSCHRLFGEGSGLGPDLTGYDRRNRESLLLNIVDPSLDVREGYQIYTVTTRDNRQLTGTLLARSEHLIAIQPYGSIARIELSTKEIVDMEASSVSMMPGGILESMGDQEVQDLFAYLMSDLTEL